MELDQIITCLRRIQRWLNEEEPDVLEAREDLKHLLDTIDPGYVEESPHAELFNGLFDALRAQQQSITNGDHTPPRS